MKAHDHTVTSVHSNEKPVPLIRLSGQWLDHHGFKPGRKFIVYEMPGSLLINLVLPEDVQNQLTP